MLQAANTDLFNPLVPKAHNKVNNNNNNNNWVSIIIIIIIIIKYY